MVSFHVLLDKRNTPVRVDTPSWTFKRETTVSDFTGGRDVLVNVNWTVSLLMSGYGGLKDYNIWLKRVDEKVRLSNDVIRHDLHFGVAEGAGSDHHPHKGV